MSDTPKTDAQRRGDFVHVNFARELERENAALRAASVEACALARVGVTIWHDKLSDESVQLFTQLEKKILREVQP